VIVSNQDGLGTASFPLSDFEAPQRFMVESFAAQGIEFAAVLLCPHLPSDGCGCRKPALGLVTPYLAAHPLDLAKSAVIGDRDTDLELAARLGVRGLKVQRHGLPDETWEAAVRTLLERRARISRHTKETQIEAQVNLDASGPLVVGTGIGFFDHMLEQLARHGGFALELACRGDLHIDEHHTVEDCALSLGEALRAALGDKRGIARYGFLLPMDESRAQVALDLSGRACFVFEGKFNREAVGGLPTELVPHFFNSLSQSLGAALHLQVQGDNAHHMIEACFKGVGRALRQAFKREGDELPTTKGVL